MTNWEAGLEKLVDSLNKFTAGSPPPPKPPTPAPAPADKARPPGLMVVRDIKGRALLTPESVADFLEHEDAKRYAPTIERLRKI